MESILSYTCIPVWQIILANQGDSPGQPKRSLHAATAIRYNYSVQLVAIKARLDARTEFEILEHLLKGGEAGRAHHCRVD